MPCPSLRPAERRPPEEGSVACLLILHVCDETKSPIEQKHLGTLCEYELILFGTENCWRKRKALPPAMAPQDLQAQRRGECEMEDIVGGYTRRNAGVKTDKHRPRRDIFRSLFNFVVDIFQGSVPPGCALCNLHMLSLPC